MFTNCSFSRDNPPSSFLFFSRFWVKTREIVGFKKTNLSFQTLVSLLLFAVFIIAILSHVIFSVGLSLDGVKNLTNIIYYNSFWFNEKSRMLFHFLYQLPTWLFIKFSFSDSISSLISVFSFGLIWIHLLSIIGCWLILPKNKKSYIFFPLFAFLIGPLTSLDQSISVSLSVFSYVWFTAFVIYYSDLSINKHKFLFVLIPLPLCLSHELMSYAALFLIFLCLGRLLREKNKTTSLDKIMVISLILFLIATFFIAVYFTIFPNSFLNRDRFMLKLINLKFLYDPKDGVYPYIALALILTLIPFFQIFRSSLLKGLFLLFSGFALLIFNLILLIPDLHGSLNQIFPIYIYPISSSRVWVFFILPFTLFLWILFEQKKLQFKHQKVFLIFILISSVSLAKWRVQMDYNFKKLQSQFSANLNPYTGIIESTIVKEFVFVPQHLSHFLYLNFIGPASLIFPRSRKVKAIVLNPAHPECLSSCKNNKVWNKYYYFNNTFISKEKLSFHCRKECLSYINLQFNKRIQKINTRFFDLTSLREHFEK